MRWKKTLALAAAASLSLWAGHAGAQNLNLNEMAAALAFPIVTGGQAGNPVKDTQGDVVIPNQTAATLVTVTNGRSDDVLLKLDMISGDRDDGDNWQSSSFDCLLTGRETTTFVFTKPLEIVWGDGNSEVYVECSSPGDPTGAPRALYTNLANGILFVAVADPQSGAVISEDVIFGDAVVADMLDAQAYSFGAIPFQAGRSQNDGDKVYRFDGQEYSHFPSVLATNFITPSGGVVNAELILFTLDGTVGNLPVPRAKLGGFAYDDDEVAFDFSYEFDCFDIVSLRDVNPNLFWQENGPGFGSISGHLELVPQPIAAENGADAHDVAFGDGNNSRKRPVHGWIVQNVNGLLLPGDEPIVGTPPGTMRMGDVAAWGRPLSASRTVLIPFLGDSDPVLNADPTGGSAASNGGGNG